MQVAEWTPSTLLALGARAMSGPINTIVTNVPGPQIPLYFHGARVREIYPMVPLMDGMGLGIAVTSYAGTMNFGFNADPDIVPDLDRFTAMMRGSLERVAAEAGVPLAAVAGGRRAPGEAGRRPRGAACERQRPRRRELARVRSPRWAGSRARRSSRSRSRSRRTYDWYRGPHEPVRGRLPARVRGRLGGARGRSGAPVRHRLFRAPFSTIPR